MEIVREITGSSPLFVTETRQPAVNQSVRNAFIKLMVSLDDDARAAIVAEFRQRKQVARAYQRPVVAGTPKRTPVRPELIDTPATRQQARVWLGLDGPVVDGGELVAEQAPSRVIDDSPAARAAARALFDFFNLGGE